MADRRAPRSSRSRSRSWRRSPARRPTAQPAPATRSPQPPPSPQQLYTGPLCLMRVARAANRPPPSPLQPLSAPGPPTRLAHLRGQARSPGLQLTVLPAAGPSVPPAAAAYTALHPPPQECANRKTFSTRAPPAGRCRGMRGKNNHSFNATWVVLCARGTRTRGRSRGGRTTRYWRLLRGRAGTRSTGCRGRGTGWGAGPRAMQCGDFLQE